jgi:membrane fusion protein, multidrug efflux system
LKKWYFDIGTKVKAGEVLAEIDTPEVDQILTQAKAILAQAKAQLKMAQAARDLAEVTYKRYQNLFKGHYMLDELRHELDMQKQALKYEIPV